MNDKEKLMQILSISEIVAINLSYNEVEELAEHLIAFGVGVKSI